MKVTIIDDYNLIIFFNRFYTKNINFKEKKVLQQYFHNLFLKLKDNYNLKIKGYYNINVYLDKYYGAVLEIQKEDINYFDYFDSQIDMRVNIIEDSFFLYKIKDILNLDETILNNHNFYTFERNIYLELKSDISDITIGHILENGSIIYDEKTVTIKKYGKKLKTKQRNKNINKPKNNINML